MHTVNQQQLHKDNVKLATKNTRQITILQNVQKVTTPKQESTVYSFL